MKILKKRTSIKNYIDKLKIKLVLKDFYNRVKLIDESDKPINIRFVFICSFYKSENSADQTEYNHADFYYSAKIYIITNVTSISMFYEKIINKLMTEFEKSEIEDRIGNFTKWCRSIF